MTEIEFASLVCGGLSFAVCALYDLIGVRAQKRVSALFALSGLLLAGSTAALLAEAPWGERLIARPALCWVFLALAALSLALLIKALFFSFPAAQAYAGGATKPTAVTTGLYALCRHPGVLFLGLFYLFVWLAARTEALLAAFVLFTALDVLLVAWEDARVFPRTLVGYEAYKETTPFLLPNARSLRAALKTKQ